MKFGVVLPIWQLTIGEAESLTLRAEEVGLDGIFVPDHILAKPATTQHYGAHWPDPFSLLAYLAGRTRRIQLGASVIVLPYRNALVAAKAAATVDQASGGRFIFGLGRRRARVQGPVPELRGRHLLAAPGAAAAPPDLGRRRPRRRIRARRASLR